jgi:predicted dienelactone hydrolase
MRPIETILLLTNALAFIALSVSLPYAMRWVRHSAPVAILIAVAQVLVEGSRWQMVPAYILTGLFFLIWLLQKIIWADRLPGQKRNNWLAVGLAVGLGIIVLTVSIVLPVAFPVFRFPHPSGPYEIGTLTYHWVDTNRPELFTADPNDHRELMAQVWYPAKTGLPVPRAPYIQDAGAVTLAMARVIRFPDFLFTHFKYVTTNAVASAPVADNQPNYPVLIFLSGTNGFRSVNTFQIEELVSHGYIVVGFDQPGAAVMVRFPDGRQISGWPRDEITPLIMQSVEPRRKAPVLYGKALPNGIIPYFAQDVSFALDQLTGLNKADPNHILTGRLNLEHAGAFGVSLGGMNAAGACSKDLRLKACLVMDVYIPADAVKNGLQQPSMFITRDAATMRLERKQAGGWTEKDIALTLDTMRTVYKNLPGDGYYIEIPKMFHLNFTDFPYWLPIALQIGLAGPINGQRGFDIVNAYSVAFFDKYLNGRPSLLLNGPSKQYPEVNFETRRH